MREMMTKAKPKQNDPRAGRFTLTTLAKLGAQLPIGQVTADGRLVKDFKLRPFRFKEEREVEKLRDKPISMGRFVSGLLGILVEEVCGLNIQKLSDVDRALHFGRMWMPDVLYLYIYLRTQALGEILPMTIPCRACRAAFQLDGDLTGLDVRIVERPEQIDSHVTLTTGISYRGTLRRELRTRPVVWSAFEDEDINDKAAVKLSMFQNSIVGMEGIADEEMAVVPDVAFDDMTKRDVEILTRHLEHNTPGPQMVVEAECPKCRTEWFWPIDWSYDHFFGSSSLSVPPTS
jgi:hypothetical protein